MLVRIILIVINILIVKTISRILFYKAYYIFSFVYQSELESGNEVLYIVLIFYFPNTLSLFLTFNTSAFADSFI